MLWRGKQDLLMQTLALFADCHHRLFQREYVMLRLHGEELSWHMAR
jgi:hypothetical protein